MAARKRGTPGTRKKGKPRSSSATRRAPATSFALTRITPDKLGIAHPEPDKQKALAALLKTGNVAGACIMAGIGRSTWYRWGAEDKLFAQLAAEIEEAATDELEAEASRRAKTGSDTLLIFLLKSRRRAKYADRDVVTTLHAEVQLRLQQQAQLIASQEHWDAEKLLQELDRIWA